MTSSLKTQIIFIGIWCPVSPSLPLSSQENEYRTPPNKAYFRIDRVSQLLNMAMELRRSSGVGGRERHVNSIAVGTSAFVAVTLLISQTSGLGW